MPLAGVVPLDAMRLLLARVQLPDRQEHVIDGVIVRAGEPGAPAPQARDEALASGFVTPPAPSPPTALKHDPKPSRPKGGGSFSGSATSRRARSPPPGLLARASGRKPGRTARARPGSWAWRRPGAGRCGSWTSR